MVASSEAMKVVQMDTPMVGWLAFSKADSMVLMLVCLKVGWTDNARVEQMVHWTAE